MKKIIYSLLVCGFVSFVISCTDESLDPLQFKNVKKGTLLALRGTQLNNIYVKGLPGADFVPTLATSATKFSFDAEFLSADPASLASFDIFVIKKVGTTRERVLLTNIPFSQFKTTADYPNPWVSVSLNLSDILAKVLGHAVTLPIANASPDLNTLFVTYKTGIDLEMDLNLTDGSKVLAADLVAAGLTQSNQFYPAQKLTYAVVKYCTEDLAGPYNFSTVVTAVGDGGHLDHCVGAITGSGEFKVIGLGIYSISDVTFGQYDCAWDDDPATGATLVNICDELHFGGSDQYKLVYTMSDAVVSGDGKSMTFKWENDYGDKGTTTITRTDTKLFPLTLHN